MKPHQSAIQHSPRVEPSDAEPIAITASVPLIGEFSFYVHGCPDQYISGSLLRDKIWEPFETKVFCRLCRPADVVVDLGANIGWYSIIASQLVGPNGRVFSFEPDPRNLRLLRKNALTSRLAELIEIYEHAIADRESTSRLFLCQNNLGDHRLFDDGSPRSNISVVVRTLDSQFFNSSRRPTLVKSDTQGSEARILRGSSNLLAHGWRPIWIIEFWPYGLVNSGDDPLELFVKLTSLGYNLYELTEENPRLTLLTEGRLLTRLNSDISPRSMGYINLVCLPHESDRWPSIMDLVYNL
jgi:FkbM family methyltransferase